MTVHLEGLPPQLPCCAVAVPSLLYVKAAEGDSVDEVVMAVHVDELVGVPFVVLVDETV